MSSNCDRRSFIGTTVAIAAATAIAPNLAFAAPEVAKGELLADLGKCTDLDSGEPVLVKTKYKDKDGKDVEDAKVYVRAVKTEGGLDWIVLSAICTHLKCKIEYKSGDDHFRCPCHKSEFDLTGTVLKKPAKKDLPDFSDKVSEEDGRLYLRKSA